MKVTADAPVKHDGQDYAEGDSFEVTDKQAEALIAAGVVHTGRKARHKDAEKADGGSEDKQP